MSETPTRDARTLPRLAFTIQDGGRRPQPRPRLAALLLAASVFATPAQDSAGGAAFAAGRAHYDAGRYEQAVTSLEQAVSAEPGNSEYHQWLGRSYGRSAEHGPWYRALPLVRRTLKHFRRAVALDPGNRAAWEDLREFYRQAPGFLGGSERKARDIDARLAATAAP